MALAPIYFVAIAPAAVTPTLLAQAMIPKATLQSDNKGMGTLLKILHLSYSFGQKCSKLGTFTVKGLKIQKRE
jgi:hypothetical protein